MTMSKNLIIAQSAFTCSKLITETLEQVNNRKLKLIGHLPAGVVLVSLLLTLNIVHTLF